MSEALKILGIIASDSDSAIITLLIVLVLGLIIGIPIYKVSIKAKEKKREQYLEQRKQEEKREDKLLRVITQNSNVITELSTLIRTNQLSCAECKAEQVELYRQLSHQVGEVDTTVKDFRSKAEILVSRIENNGGI